MPKDTEIIMNLIGEKGKSAAKMTNVLKEIGDGSMGDGIAKIANYFMSEGKSVGRLQGAIGVTMVVSLVCSLYKVVKNKKHKLDGEKIISSLKKASAESDTEESINNEINNKEA